MTLTLATTQSTNVVQELTVEEGIKRALEIIETTQREMILLQSQCVGNIKYTSSLESATSIVSALAVYSKGLRRDLE